jgi:prepilin-type N-terminal cleavage/methylation domain-containing protein
MLFRPVSARRHAFTLVELLVVIAIISILIAISLIVGERVVSGGKARATADTIRVLDSALADYVNRVGNIPDPTARVETTANAGTTDNLYPVFDGRDLGEGDEPVINSVGFFLYQAEGTSGISATIATINARFVRNFDPDGAAGPQPELTTVFDAWDRPIRYVHPFFDGAWTDGDRAEGQAGNPVDLSDEAMSPLKNLVPGELQVTQVRRNFLTDADRQATAGLVGDSDGGMCPTPRPYFYSAGGDGDPSTLDDNVYSTKPTRPKQSN